MHCQKKQTVSVSTVRFQIHNNCTEEEFLFATKTKHSWVRSGYNGVNSQLSSLKLFDN